MEIQHGFDLSGIDALVAIRAEFPKLRTGYRRPDQSGIKQNSA
jgi:hypothetical protein